VSKRSYRRLAVVAGAALAVGTMTPAMAAHVNANGTGTATVDVSDVSLPSAGTLIPGALIADAQDFALDTVFGGQALVLGTVGDLQNDVSGIVTDLLGATSNLSVGLNANANASSGGATVQVGGAAVGGADLLGALPDPGTALSGVQGSLTPVVGFGVTTANRALTLAGSAQNTVLTTGSGLLGTGLGVLDGASVSGNVLAALMASL
jgi:hypothetical protein